MASFGFIFYLAVGATLLSTNWKLAQFYGRKSYLDKEKAFGSMCILTSFVFLSDAIVSGLKFKNDE
jgi:hypothetical protein